MSDKPSLEPSIALAAYAEPLLAGKRVLVFGNALGALAEQLLARGARLVHVCDTDPLRVSQAAARNASAQLSFSPLTDGDLAVREGSFELALIDNLGAFDALSVLRKARRALTARGAVLAAAPNPDVGSPLVLAHDPGATALDYYALYDAVAAEFEHVRMLGQTPFVGYAVVDFSASQDPEPALDTGFVAGGSEEPDIFLALGSMHALSLDDYAVIQLPTRALLEAAAGGDDAALREARAAERRARLRCAELEAALRKRPEPAPTTHDTREIERLNQWIVELESRAATADERADQAEAELEETRARAEAELGELHAKLVEPQKLEQLTRELGDARAEAARAHKLAQERDALLKEQGALLKERDAQLKEQGALLAARETELKAALARAQELAAGAEQGVADELGNVEHQLKERGHEVRRLERELRAAERTGRELVRELGRRAVPSEDPALARALAERDADLQAATWTIDTLSQRLAATHSDEADPGSR